MIYRAASVRNDMGLPVLDTHEAARLTVYLDNVPQKNAVAYDMDRGIVWRYKATLDGELLISQGSTILEEVFGEVNVIEKR